MKHIKLRGNIYHLNYRVPKRLLNRVGKTFVQQSLSTDSLKIARLRRDIILREYSNLLDDKEVMFEMIKKIQLQYNDIKTQDDAEAFDAMHEISEDTMKTDPVFTNAVLNVTTPNSSVITISAKETLKETTKLFLLDIKDKSSSYINRTKLSSALYIEYSNVELSAEVSRRNVGLFIGYLLETKSVKTTRNYLSCLASIWGHAYNREQAKGTNPFLSHKIYKKEVTNSYKPFTVEQWEIYYPALVSSATTEPRKALLAIGLLTGMRLNEVLGLKCSDIQQDKTGLWFINLQPNEYRTLKNSNSTRVIPITDLLLPVLLELKKTDRLNGLDSLLFPEVSKINTNDKSSSIAKWLNSTRKATITSNNQSFHSLRVMLATAFEQAEVSELTASKVLGHKVTSMTYGLYSKGSKLEQVKLALDKAALQLEPFTRFLNHQQKKLTGLRANQYL